MNRLAPNKFFTDEELVPIKRQGKTLTVALERKEINFTEFTDEKLYEAKGNVFVYDLEIYPGYFLAAFQCYATKQVVYFERTPEKDFDKHKLLWLLHNGCHVGFNSANFDLPLLWLALQGANNEALKNVTDFIIKGNWRIRDIEQAYSFKCGKINHIDLIEVAPLSASLKTYAGRLHAPRLQDLPYNPNTYLTQAQRDTVRLYCINDLECTSLLLKELCPQLELRAELSLYYGMDLRSKGDAQISETVVCSEVAKITGRNPKRQTVEPGTTFKYDIPGFIKYKTPVLQHMLEVVRDAEFVVRDTGKVLIPQSIDNLQLSIGISNYNLTIGGLHSTESSASHVATEEVLLLDVDAASFYPNIVLNLKLFPENMGLPFLTVYSSIVRQRLDAKDKVGKLKKIIEQNQTIKAELKKAKVETDSKKIVINAGFGLLGSKYSRFYSPKLMITVTLTGQLSLLMLIEMIELVGIPVVSGNTDGIVMKCPVEKYDELLQVIKQWEQETGFETEETRYKAIYSADVNNYLAIKEKGDAKAEFFDDRMGCKVKGRYAERGSALNSVLSKNPQHLVCSDAVIALLTHNIPVEETIKSCTDIRRFISLMNVKGGAEKDGFYLGKVVRYYYAKYQQGCISYISNGNKVANSEGGRPCMDLPEEFPTDVDYEKYISITNGILFDIGFYKREQQIKFF